MVKANPRTNESFLKHVFESGYANAVLSLSKFIPDKITSTNFHFGFHRFDNTDQSNLPSFNRTGTNLLITTEIFGDITGKSYLFLSEHDVNVFTRGIYGSVNHIESLKDEFLKELDNILSASVITKIS